MNTACCAPTCATLTTATITVSGGSPTRPALQQRLLGHAGRWLQTLAKALLLLTEARAGRAQRDIDRLLPQATAHLSRAALRDIGLDDQVDVRAWREVREARDAFNAELYRL